MTEEASTTTPSEGGNNMTPTQQHHKTPTDAFSIATGKGTTATVTTSNTAGSNLTAGAVRSDDDDDEEISLQDEDDWLSNSQRAQFPDIPGFTQPLRINAGSKQQQQQQQMSASTSSLHSASSKRMVDSVSNRSGSRSPAPHQMFDGGSSISSLEDAGIDTDVLTDRLGTLELDWKAQQQLSQELNKSLSNLPPVAERLSEETLEDCHAFCDIKGGGTMSRGGSITTGGEVSSTMLEPLDEVEEDDEDPDAHVIHGGGSKIKITNMEEILEGVEEDADTAAANPPPPR